MTFNSFIEDLIKLLNRPLPGEAAQFLMAPEGRIERSREALKYAKPRLSSVLILLFPDNEQILFPLILRPSYPGVHSGQVSFPGGKKEEHEEIRDTALRETEEELGIKKNSVNVLGNLTEIYIPPSNYLVKPFIGYVEARPAFIPEKKEVEKIIEADMVELIKNANVREHTFLNSRGSQMQFPYYDINEYKVWGATAMILSEFIQLFKQNEENQTT